MNDQFLTSIQGKQLRELQLCELEILKDFIKVCDKLNLTWYLCGGTLLGCVRHQGFIPWDDDIDVCMPRKDYDIFCKKAQNILQKKHFLQTYKTDPNYSMASAKIRNSETTFIEASCKTHKINHGVYIDIFQLDEYKPTKKIKNIKNQFFMDLIRLSISKSYSYPVTTKQTVKTKIHSTIATIFYRNKNIQELNQEADKIAKSYQNKKTTYYRMYHTNSECKQCEKTIFGDGVLLDFENIKVRVPTNYDEYLTQTYGNYMQLPPKSERIGHHYISAFNLKKSYKEGNQRNA